MEVISKFSPPYLNADKPEDLKKIKSETATYTKKSRMMHINEVNRTKISNLDISKFQEETHEVLSAEGTKITFDSLNVNRLKKETQPVKVKAKKAAPQLASLPISISPAGNVSLGFNCYKEFSISINQPGDYFQWYIVFKDSSGGYTGLGQYLGTTPTNQASFSLDHSSYLISTYIINGSNTATFRICCSIILNGVSYPAIAMQSDEVILQFNGTSCIGIHNTELSADTFRGGQNGDEPTLTIYLDAPAPPGGQIVYLSVSNTNLGGILGSGNFTIGAGQTSGSISGFLGTERVFITGRTFHINSRVNTSTTSSKITLNKQRR